MAADEIKEAPYPDEPHVDIDTAQAEVEDKFEVFKRGDGQVDFRTVSWIRASVIFLKSPFPRIISFVMILTRPQSFSPRACSPSLH